MFHRALACYLHMTKLSKSLPSPGGISVACRNLVVKFCVDLILARCGGACRASGADACRTELNRIRKIFPFQSQLVNESGKFKCTATYQQCRKMTDNAEGFHSYDLRYDMRKILQYAECYESFCVNAAALVKYAFIYLSLCVLSWFVQHAFTGLHKQEIKPPR